ncbi:reverse transcriptase/maturase family protein [Streptomyces sp. NWU339]|uniref:reverse transcriptase/maturase family protein n=1 Tax=Streptomyces sp. NWU339 TaxID=2185284 RepID=UPI0015E80B81|nr:reverse transcriptase/maturase family protein [Streptomyces sp. NWU339]
MQSAETVLGVLRERGRRGLPLEELYRQMFNPQLYLLAYGRIYSNHGAMTPGVSGETADGMSIGKINRIIDAMRHERFRFRPVRRTHIPKKNGKTRPLGLPSWTDKLVGEVMRLLLEAYYEPTFSDRSHGFRPGRGCHTALTEVANTWTGTTWFIEGDIADCFGSFDHEVVITILSEKIHDNRFLLLVRNMLAAGYMEDWVWHATLSGSPQGGVLSPLLSSIYLHKLDTFIEQTLIPEYTRGEKRRHNSAYVKLSGIIERGRRRGDRAVVREARKQRRMLPSKDPYDSGYRRLRYCRYADDHLLGFTGPKAEAEQIKARLAAFLREELKLELSPDKTLITHARSQAARFLGYEITAHHDHRKGARGRRWTDGFIKLNVPRSVVKAKCARHMRRGKPAHRRDLVNESDYTIVATFGAEYRGLVQYYLLAGDVYKLNRLEWVMRTAMLRTLAAKHRSSVSKMTTRHRVKTETPYGLRTCFEATQPREGRKPLVARFGGIPLRRNKNAVPHDRVPSPTPHRHREVVRRLLRSVCELCHRRTEVETHQVRTLAGLTGTGTAAPGWKKLMADKRRKTLIVCGDCHDSIHTGTPAG